MEREELMKARLSLIGAKKGMIDREDGSTSIEYALGFADGWKEADDHPCLKLWHTRKELNLFKGTQALIVCDNFHIVEANYCGSGIGNEPRFTVNGLMLDNRQIVLWCDRMDLISKTNWRKP